MRGGNFSRGSVQGVFGVICPWCNVSVFSLSLIFLGGRVMGKFSVECIMGNVSLGECFMGNIRGVVRRKFSAEGGFVTGKLLGGMIRF